MTLHREIMTLEKESNKLKCLIFQIIKKFSHKLQIRAKISKQRFYKDIKYRLVETTRISTPFGVNFQKKKKYFQQLQENSAPYSIF